MDPPAADFGYDHCTPDMVAGFTLSLSYQFPSCVARGIAILRTAPFAYWQHALEPQLSAEQEQHWGGSIKRELVKCCDILRNVYGEPDLP